MIYNILIQREIILRLISILIMSSCPIKALTGLKDSRPGDTLLHTAVRNESREMICFLLKNDRSLLSVTNSDGDTPLHVAVQKNSPQLVDAIMRYGGHDHSLLINKDGSTPFHLAVKSNMFNTANMMLRHWGSLGKAKDKNGNTPLHIAAKLGYENMAKLLLNYNSSILTVKNNYGETAVYAAVYTGYENMVKLMLDYNSRILTLKNDYDETVYADVYAAAAAKNLKLLERLIRYDNRACDQLLIFGYDPDLLNLILKYGRDDIRKIAKQWIAKREAWIRTRKVVVETEDLVKTPASLRRRLIVNSEC